MTIDRGKWSGGIEEDFTSSFPCPRCKSGRVSKGDNELKIEEPGWSAASHDHPDWEPEWNESRFTVMLKCDNRACREVVSVSGISRVVHVQDHSELEEFEDYLTLVHEPASMSPAPPLFPFPKHLPREVESELRLAFQLYWMSLSASTARLRTCLERVLDDQAIPHHQSDSQGRARHVGLARRIELFAQNYQNVDVIDSLTATRIVGNAGTHETDINYQEYFDLIDVFEHALFEIYESRKEKFDIMRARLIEDRR